MRSRNGLRKPQGANAMGMIRNLGTREGSEKRRSVLGRAERSSLGDWGKFIKRIWKAEVDETRGRSRSKKGWAEGLKELVEEMGLEFSGE